MYPVTLTGRDVTLREFRTDDVAASLAIVGDDQVTQWLAFDRHDQAATRAMIDGVVKRAQDDPRTEYYLAATAPDDELIGFARLGLSGVKAAKLGYAIRADRWGKGYATDVARQMVTFAFEQLGLHRVSAAIGPGNAASIAVVHKLGMRYEGRLRDHVLTKGTWRDSLLYSVLVQEWTA
ncbi:GNAT family N-acetyltransferase [Couchioplanes caeruleus]|uniref:GNAT family N-acetyltransferase n=2 Tax=Couchioplanes caeruleus TaxID=56438 RepID=A0A1K0GQI1_9ACTN|nr:GNAT family protein [Couchioplanes caeruleus]OJF11523.1 GNAT family N-acetyltransferase [Couchioplanes caeruleus subsp. caeruleus]ROP31271.1 RimJ/RimL family protein N-acetyltransferase [Couchioplanes caeruleus]